MARSLPGGASGALRQAGNQNGGPPARRPACDPGGLAADLALEALLEPLDLAGRIDDRLLPGEERVAVAADVDPQLRSGRADRPFGAARSAVDLGLEILGMDIGLHEV